MPVKKLLKATLSKIFSHKQINSLSDKLQSLLPGYLDRRNMFFYINNLKSYGYKPDMVIDIGAYMGEWTKECKKIFPDAKFLMIEAQKKKEEALQKIVATHPNTFYEISMLGNKHNKEVVFYEMETGSSLYEEQTSYARKKEVYEMVTLDSVVEKHNVDGQLFLKLDVQGAEIDVLEGAGSVLERVDFILLEASLLDYNKNAPLIADVIAFLKDKGFLLFEICEQRRKPDHTLFQIDLIFSKQNSTIRIEKNVF